MTRDSERAMLMYAQLASIAARKQQPIGRDRFLVLTGASAMHAGWPEVADHCQRLIVEHAPRHLLAGYSSFADALRDGDFTPFLRQTERFCPPERAEHLLSEMGVTLPATGESQSVGDVVLTLLSGSMN